MIRHLIIFNLRDGMSHDECLEKLEIGRRELTKIPGVIRYTYGTAVLQDAKFKYTLAVDFEHEGIIESYKHHPLHVAYADNHFRPMAPERITTDYRIADGVE